MILPSESAELIQKLAHGPTAKIGAISEIGSRTRDLFRLVVEAYLESGEPIGSQTLAKRWGTRPSGSKTTGGGLSPATIRNIMSDLEEVGLLYSPRTSAGRIPTEAGFRVFVEGLLEITPLDTSEQARIDSQCRDRGQSFPQLLSEATEILSELSHCASLVMIPKPESILKHIEFALLSNNRALVVMVTNHGQVENRLIDLPAGTALGSLERAANYLNSRLSGSTIEQARNKIQAEIHSQQSELDSLTKNLIAAGIASWADAGAEQQGRYKQDSMFIVRGQSNLLGNLNAIEDLDRVRKLFQTLEAKQSIIKLLEATHQAEGIQIYIGAESDLFQQTGCSAILAPYANGNGQLVGTIGVIGPTKMNYARIVPMVDYTAKLIGSLMESLPRTP